MKKPFRRMSWPRFSSLNHGTQMPAHELSRFCEEEKALLHANAAVVRVLEAAGISCRRADGNRVVAVHSITDSQTLIEQWRNLNLLPAVQVRKRQKDVVTLEAYCAQIEWGKRMRLLTSGTRCPVDQVGTRIDFLHERINSLRERRWFTKIAELISCGIEFTAEMGPDGFLLYHVHAHLIYRILKPIPKAEFREFLSRWKNHFRGCHCPDSGRIRDLREACKYPCKSADLLGILSAGELPALHHQLVGRKLFQTYGGLRALRADLRESREKIKRRRLEQVDKEAVTLPKKQKIEYVRVAPQSATRVHYHRRRFPTQEAPTNIFLGYTHPFPDKKNGRIGVHELWMNPTLPPEKLRELRKIPRWSPPEWRQRFDEDGARLQVHTNISSSRLEDPLPDEEPSPFLADQDGDAEGSPPSEQEGHFTFSGANTI